MDDVELYLEPLPSALRAAQADLHPWALTDFLLFRQAVT
jgi:hypothetical protein